MQQQQKPSFSRFSHISKLLLITFAFALLIQTNAQSQPIINTRAQQTIGLSKSSPKVVMGLDYQNTFDMTLTSVDGTQSSFCNVYPSETVSKLKIQIPLKVESPDMSFDNIIFYNNHYLLVDTVSFQIYAIMDFLNVKTQFKIPSNFKNEKVDEEDYYEVFVTTDEKNGVLYIATANILLSYELKNFMKAIQTNSPIPPISKVAKNFTKVSSINAFRYFKGKLYMAADNVVHIWNTNAVGDLTPIDEKWNSSFFGTPRQVSIVDIGFYETRAYVLDSMSGIYAVRLPSAEATNFTMEGFQYKVDKGQFLEVVGDSVNVVGLTKKVTMLYEYTITEPKKANNTVPTLSLNRKTELYQAVFDIYNDGKLLYLITGLWNIVYRPMVPGKYDSEYLEGYIMNYWSLPDFDSLVPVGRGDTNQVIAIHEGSKTMRQVSIYNFETEDPSLECSLQNVEEGDYLFELKSLQTDCEGKEVDDINVICETKQKIKIVLGGPDAIGDVTNSRYISLGLVVGITFFFVLILIFIGMVRKYKKQYNTLESEYKFKRFRNQDKSGQGEKSSKAEVSEEEI